MLAEYFSYEAIAILMFATMLVMLLTGQRVFGAIGFVAAAAALLLWGDGAVEMPFTASWKLFKWYPMLTLPLFIYMGYMISESGIANDLYKMFHVYFGGTRGGLAIGTMFMMVAISAMNGLSVAGMAVGATIALPEMLKRNYDKRMISGVVQAGSSLGILIPPSVVLVLYGMIARQPVSKLWLAGLIPGLNADRADMITGGMYILKSRCANMDFSDPIGVFGDAMLVPKGNPQNINNYADVIKTGAKLVTGTGFNTVEAAKKYGVPDSQMLLVEGEVGILAAMKAGRADVAVQTFFGAKEHEKKTNGKFEVTDPKLMPKETLNVVGIGFRKTDDKFREAFNAALAKVMANPGKMLKRAGEYGYDKAQLPPPDMSTEWACSTK